jgi:hypothetical protein
VSRFSIVLPSLQVCYRPMVSETECHCCGHLLRYTKASQDESTTRLLEWKPKVCQRFTSALTGGNRSSQCQLNHAAEFGRRVASSQSQPTTPSQFPQLPPRNPSIAELRQPNTCHLQRPLAQITTHVQVPRTPPSSSPATIPQVPFPYVAHMHRSFSSHFKSCRCLPVPALSDVFD